MCDSSRASNKPGRMLSQVRNRVRSTTSGNLLRGVVAATVLALSVGCLPASTFHSDSLRATAAPEFRPELFFAGTTHGEGTLVQRWKSPRKLRVEGHGQWAADSVFVLGQAVTFDDGSTETRTWHLRRQGAQGYTGRLSDASGNVKADVHGNVFHLRYLLRQPAVYMEQYLYLQPDGRTVLNVATVSVIGIPWARLSERITRGEAAARPVAAAAGQPRYAAPAIKHVFVIVLENKNYATTFGSGSTAPYLADTLVRKGALLRQYYGIGHLSLGNYIAMISGIAPDPATQADCQRFVEFTQTGLAPDGQPIGNGCVYPAQISTIADQLAAHHLTWKGYMEDMGNDPQREAATCGHPAVGAPDLTERATPNDQYATKHNPFAYFHSIIDSPSCAQNVIPLDGLAADLQSADRTPNLAFIVPNLCHDGHDQPCRNGEPGGLVSANAFLAHWVPLITQSPAFREDGLLIVTFDEAGSADASACCNEPSGPNTPRPGTTGPGGGRTGTVLLSSYIRPGTVTDVPYNHYSMLRSIEDIFHLPYLGYAGEQGLRSFGPDVYTFR